MTPIYQITDTYKNPIADAESANQAVRVAIAYASSGRSCFIRYLSRAKSFLDSAGSLTSEPYLFTAMDYENKAHTPERTHGPTARIRLG